LTVSNKFNCSFISLNFVGSFPPDFLAASRYNQP